MRYYKILFFIFLIQTAKAQLMLPAYQGVQYKNGIEDVAHSPLTI